jgi:hypothetical protein
MDIPLGTGFGAAILGIYRENSSIIGKQGLPSHTNYVNDRPYLFPKTRDAGCGVVLGVRD